MAGGSEASSRPRTGTSEWAGAAGPWAEAGLQSLVAQLTEFQALLLPLCLQPQN